MPSTAYMEEYMQNAKTFKELLTAFKKCRDCYATNALRLCQDNEVLRDMQARLGMPKTKAESIASFDQTKTPGFHEVADHLMLMGFNEDAGPYNEPDGSQLDVYYDYLSSLNQDAAKKLQALKIFIEVWVLHTKIPKNPDWVGGDPLSASYVSQD